MANKIPSVVPRVFYDDVPAALQWLEQAFGFETQMTITSPDGNVFAQMVAGGTVIQVSSPGGHSPHDTSPRSLGSANTQNMHVYVDDVTAHHARAREAGAKILEELSEKFYGDREYRAEDPEGHRWAFNQRLRETTPDEWGLPDDMHVEIRA